MSMGNLLISTHQPHGSAPQGTTTLMQLASVINQATMSQSMNALMLTGVSDLRRHTTLRVIHAGKNDTGLDTARPSLALW